ncbi:hypothetical protein GIB67_042415, partial [Kingdonia uniflora]
FFAALRRFQAGAWLEVFVGPLGLSENPSEREFLSFLRNGIVLCNAINKIQPGAVSKVIESHSLSPISEAQPLPAYQYFENVRNFLVAVEELKLPAFQASDLERSVEAGSTGKIVDCILALKSYHEWKQWSIGMNGCVKPSKSPMGQRSTNRIQSRVAPESPVKPGRHLDMSVVTENGKLDDAVVGALVESMLDQKENMDHELVASFCNGNTNSLKLLSKILPGSLQEPLNQRCEVKSTLNENFSEVNNSLLHSKFNPTESFNYKHCRSCSKKDSCIHWRLVEVQEKDLTVSLFILSALYFNVTWLLKTLRVQILHLAGLAPLTKSNKPGVAMDAGTVVHRTDLKALLTRTKMEFEALQNQLQTDLNHLGNKVQELSSDALGYHRVVRENRHLYNTVQDLKGNIRVYCRIRPACSTEAKIAIDSIGEDGSLVLIDPLNPHKDTRKVFHFNRVFSPTATQEEVFKDTQPLIRSVMDGYNICIFAYGQTGSGKTHTMSGPSGGSTKDKGINFLALNDLFRISCSRKNIMNYEIRNCASNGGLSLPDATMHLVKSTNDVLNLMKLGEMNRFVSSTALNNRSSRSHSVLTVHVQGKDISGSIQRSCLHLVDLAGSERVDKSEVTGDRLKEAQYINRSLSCLGDVITALAQKNSHIPYRNSKLTQLLQDSLGGHAKTLMFAHVSPEADSYAETVSTLKFAERTSTVELGAARLNKESAEVRELRKQVESLKKALTSKEAQTAESNKVKEVKHPPEKTPPRSRRVSIEGSVTVKSEKSKVMTERTPPRPRRLSIETPTIPKMVNQENRKGSKTPLLKVKISTVCTTPERTPPRSRRLSLEGPKNGMRNQIKSSENACSIDTSDFGRGKNLELSNCTRNYNKASCLTEEVYLQYSPRSPTISSCKGQTVGKENRIRIQPVPVTPEPSIFARNEFQIVMPNEHKDSNKIRTPAVPSYTSKKGSQIRKSIQTIGKLINPSDKRNQKYPLVLQSTTDAPSKTIDGSSLTASSRALRRQSLTGGPITGLSRRSSLGESTVKQNAQTPPPVHLSSKMSSPWM